jgi:2-haloacid dehalogenase
MEPGKNHTSSPAIVFDLGGVLLDWDPYYLYKRYFHDDRAAVERFLNEIEFKEWNRRQDEGRPFREAVSEKSRLFPQYAGLIRAYDDCWEEMMGGAIQPTIEVMRRLKEAGYPLYGLSNWSQEKFLQVRPQYDFLDWLEDILISGEVEIAKPDPRIYEIFLQRIGREAGDCLYIDDTAENIAVAGGLGFRTILFESAGQLLAELRSRELLPDG